jgi:hypothetical protein
MTIKIVSPTESDIESGLILKENPWTDFMFSDVRYNNFDKHVELIKILSADTIYIRSTVDYDGDVEISCLSFVKGSKLIGTPANFHMKKYVKFMGNFGLNEDFLKNKKNVKFIFIEENCWAGPSQPMVKCAPLTAVLFENNWGSMLFYADIADLLLVLTDREIINRFIAESVQHQDL